MRATKLAIQTALQTDAATAALVPSSQIFQVERSTIPQLPAIEVIAVASERQANAMVRHSLSIECTVSNPTEDDADALLAAVVQAVRLRLADAENSERPISLADGGNVLVELGGTRWSVSAAAARKRAQRARERASRAFRLDAPAPAVVAVADHGDPVGELAEWSRQTLKVPPGHHRAGEPMELLAFAESFLRDAWGAHESALSTARKNKKSALAAQLALCFLCGPLRRHGWRGAVASVSKEKSNELRKQVAAIAEASNLDVRIRKSPYPGVIESATGSFDTLSADRIAGHAAGYDLVIVDETGLFPLRARDLLAGLRSSVSAKNGRILHVSIRGDSVLFAEILANPAVVSHVHAAPPDCDIGDESAWRSSNPALGTVKSLAYMRAEVERVKGCPSDEPSFRALDLISKSVRRGKWCVRPTICGRASRMRSSIAAWSISRSTLAKREAARPRRRSIPSRARCGPGSRLVTCRTLTRARSVTALIIRLWRGAGSCGPIRGGP